jgi:hypothetical protein
MKVILSLTLLVCISIPNIFSDDLFDGKWVVKSLFLKQMIIFEHRDGETAIVNNGNREDHDVIINTDDKTVIIPGLSEYYKDFCYVVNDDGTIDLMLMAQDRNIFALMIIEELDKAKGINTLTDELVEKLTTCIMDEFSNYPVYRFYRVN